jgi:biopolymer transport protein ExbD
MKCLLEVCLIALTLTVGATSAVADESGTIPKNGSFAGTWKGTVNELPGIDLKIQQAGRNVSGDIVFYLQERQDVGTPWHVAGETASPLLDARLDGKALTFEVQHHRCHDCPELGPNVKFRLALTGLNKARLWNVTNAEAGAGLLLVRQLDRSATPPLRKGISVELPVTSKAVAVPQADREDSLIVTVTPGDSTYLGADPISATDLPVRLKHALATQQEKTVYVKADAHTSYVSVVRVLDALRTAGIRAVTLLTSQSGNKESGVRVPPKGLEMQMVGTGQAARAAANLYY